MPAQRLSMRKVREVLRLTALELSRRKVARAVGVSPATVVEYLHRARRAGLSWPGVEELDDGEIEARLFAQKSRPRTQSRPLPDWASVHTELRRKHVTLRLLWEEYREEHPEDGYRYSQFCELYRRWAGKLDVWMRQEHRGGEKLFVDYSGDGIPWVDPRTGERREAQLFVAVLGASNYTYAEATETQQLPDWISAHVRALEYLGGVPEVLVPDQTRTAVVRPCRYDPDLNPTYAEFARHYSSCVIPARPRRPRDKAKVEAGVLLAQRWIIAALRNRLFYSLGEINRAIRELLEKLNSRPLRKLAQSRRELFEKLDAPELKALPATAFEFSEWKIGAPVNLDYHVEFDRHHYSVPYRHARDKVDVRATAKVVEVFFRHRRIASHVRSFQKGGATTLTEHMPISHRRHKEWTPSRLLKWAETIGPSTSGLVETILRERPHPEQGFRACLGILRLSKRYSETRLEKACERALASRILSFHSIESILKNGLEAEPLPGTVPQPSPLPFHDNLRGPSYYN